MELTPDQSRNLAFVEEFSLNLLAASQSVEEAFAMSSQGYSGIKLLDAFGKFTESIGGGECSKSQDKIREAFGALLHRSGDGEGLRIEGDEQLYKLVLGALLLGAAFKPHEKSSGIGLVLERRGIKNQCYFAFHDWVRSNLDGEVLEDLVDQFTSEFGGVR